jgi:hypothetical protein
MYVIVDYGSVRHSQILQEPRTVIQRRDLDTMLAFTIFWIST